MIANPAVAAAAAAAGAAVTLTAVVIAVFQVPSFDDTGSGYRVSNTAVADQLLILC
jgi:hypothetical protein